MVCGEYGCPSFAQLLRFLHTLYTVHQCFPLETLPRLDYLGRHLARLFKPRMGGGRSRSQDDIRSGAGSPERCHRLRGSHLCEPRGHPRIWRHPPEISSSSVCVFVWANSVATDRHPSPPPARQQRTPRLAKQTRIDDRSGSGKWGAGVHDARVPRSALVALRWVVQPRLRVRPASGWLAGRTSFLRGDSDKLPEARCS